MAKGKPAKGMKFQVGGNKAKGNGGKKGVAANISTSSAGYKC